jgi:lipid-binding SYLF domain-containing protein
MRKTITTIILLSAMVFISGCGPSKELSVTQRRDIINEMRVDTLNEFYTELPNGREIINKSEGYGVFSNVNVNVIFVSGGGGYGMVVNNDTGEKTYMKMGEAGLGLGLGIKDFRAVIVFHDDRTMERFVTSGWEFGAEADAAFKSGEKGGAAEAAGTLRSGMSLYQFTESGITLQATLSGTKYWSDKELN